VPKFAERPYPIGSERPTLGSTSALTKREITMTDRTGKGGNLGGEYTDEQLPDGSESREAARVPKPGHYVDSDTGQKSTAPTSIDENLTGEYTDQEFEDASHARDLLEAAEEGQYTDAEVVETAMDPVLDDDRVDEFGDVDEIDRDRLAQEE
jgi:hypothetical protein